MRDHQDIADEQGYERAKTECAEWLDVQIALIKDELNTMAIMGVKPMWGSLIARLEQLSDDYKSRHQ